MNKLEFSTIYFSRDKPGVHSTCTLYPLLHEPCILIFFKFHYSLNNNIFILLRGGRGGGGEVASISLTQCVGLYSVGRNNHFDKG